jgi:hypothetical protein
MGSPKQKLWVQDLPRWVASISVRGEYQLEYHTIYILNSQNVSLYMCM